MEKIRVVHHSNQLGLGGTEKDMLLFCKYLDKERFEVHALSRRHPVPPHRVFLDAVRSRLGSAAARERSAQHALSHCRAPAFEQVLGKERVHFYTLRTLPEILREIRPHILHVHHSGNSEPPINQPDAVRGIPLIFTINGFGFQDRTVHDRRVTKILFPSFWVKEGAALWSRGDPRCGVLYCPIETPHASNDLRRDLGIAADVFVAGRIGRNADDIHDPISLKAYKEIEDEKTLFLAIAPPPVMVREAAALGIRRVLWLEPSVEDVFLSRFYNTIDVLAHARADGETFGCTIAEAMIHGKPVVTHRSHIRNAQGELVDASCGFVVEQNDWRVYADRLRRLRSDAALRRRMGEAAKKRALENFEAGLITRKLAALYVEELAKKGFA